MTTPKNFHNSIHRITLIAAILAFMASISTWGQQLHAYKNMAEGGYHFWFYSPEPPSPTLVPLRPADMELQKRMELAELLVGWTKSRMILLQESLIGQKVG